MNWGKLAKVFAQVVVAAPAVIAAVKPVVDEAKKPSNAVRLPRA